MESLNESLVKVDANGRHLFSKEQRGSLLEAYDRSGMSGRDFAKHHGVKESTFSYWLWKRRKTKPKAEAQSMSLIEVDVSPLPTKSVELEVILPSGAKVQVNDESQIPLLKTLLKELAC